MNVGPEIRRRRSELGLSLRELANSTGLSTGFLSQVENNRVSPSLASLERIGDALRVPLFEILSGDSRDPVVRASDRPTVMLEDLDSKVGLLTNFMNWQLLPFVRTLKPGERQKAVELDRAREEWIYILGGELEIELMGREPHRLLPGDSVHFASGRLISLNSIGEESLEFMCVMTPPPL